MANLGHIANIDPLGELIWTRDIIAEVLIGQIIGQYATFGGYVYVG